jgi:hypothetical protein
MQLLKLKEQDAQLGLPESRREWWDVGNGYSIQIQIGKDSCSLGVHNSKKSITFEVAKYLKVDTNLENITFGAKASSKELYLSSGIDCVVLNYTKPENYQALLKQIETILNEHFKNE